MELAGPSRAGRPVFVGPVALRRGGTTAASTGILHIRYCVGEQALFYMVWHIVALVSYLGPVRAVGLTFCYSRSRL